MATYTVTGHPLNYNDLYDPANPADFDPVKAALLTKGVGQTVTLTLSGAVDAKVKGHGALR
jgi:hypothetical protein